MPRSSSPPSPTGGSKPSPSEAQEKRRPAEAKFAADPRHSRRARRERGSARASSSASPPKPSDVVEQAIAKRDRQARRLDRRQRCFRGRDGRPPQPRSPDHRATASKTGRKSRKEEVARRLVARIAARSRLSRRPCTGVRRDADRPPAQFLAIEQMDLPGLIVANADDRVDRQQAPRSCRRSPSARRARQAPRNCRNPRRRTRRRRSSDSRASPGTARPAPGTAPRRRRRAGRRARRRRR